MSELAHATPAPGTNPDMPTPQAAAPAAAPISTSPVNAEASASAAVQASLAAPAPVEAPAPAPAPAGKVEPIVTGNKAFDQVSALLADKGVANYAAILSEATQGEVSLANKAALAETLGLPIAEMVLGQLEAEVTVQKAKGQENANALKLKAAESFGYSPEQAEETWSALTNFARSEESGLTPEDLTVMSEMLNKGGVQAEMALNDVIRRYEKSQGFTKVPSLLAGEGPTQSGFTPISKGEYAESMREAQQKYGEGSREVEALRNRRLASMQRGY